MVRKQEIELPEEPSFWDLCRFSSMVADIDPQDEICFNADQVRFFSPTSMIAIVKTCRKRALQHDGEKIFYRGLKKHTYANNLGFSDALNLKGRPYPQGAFGGKNYFPLSSLRRAQLEAVAESEDIELGDAIQLRANEISQVVSQRRSPQLQKILADSFPEIFRNTFEHGNVSGAVFCSQYWRSSERVEICIADRGIGIRNSLKENKYLPDFDGREALLSCLMPGVSSKAWRHKKKRSSQRGLWDNSGYGLFFAHQLFGSLGEFGIASGDTALQIRGRDNLEVGKCDFAGTVVSMSLDLSDPKKISACIDQIRNRAEAVKQRIGTRSVDIASVEAFLTGADF